MERRIIKAKKHTVNDVKRILKEMDKIAKTSYSLGFRLKKEMKIFYDKTIHIISQSTLKNKTV